MSDAVSVFAAFVTDTFGFDVERSKTLALDDVLRQRAAATSREPGAYVEQLVRGVWPSELRALAEALTITETYFFRHQEQFRAFADVLVEAGAPNRRLHVLSAACASGEEAYSLAAAIRAQPETEGWDISVTGADVNPAMLEKARQGRYSAWSLRETPEPLKEACFVRDGASFVVDDALRGQVSFEEHNLVTGAKTLLLSERFDVVFCRNMLMYLTPQHAAELVSRFARALAPNGFLFLGHAETLRGLSNDFHLLNTHGTFYYRRKPRLGAETRRAPAERVVNAIDAGSAWVDAIHQASERVRTITGERPAVAMPSSGAAAPEPAAAVELLRAERFSDAASAAGRLPQDAEGLLLRAVALTHEGNLPAARSACGKLLELDELNAGAHYLLALCAEASGDSRTARQHDQTAVYLDAAFAMPRLHLGLLARRAGELSEARRELGQALNLFPHEDASRILLFGGGFDRGALVALCRAELTACGGAS